MTAPAQPAGHVVVIDDDEGMRASLDSLLRSAGHAVTTYAEPDAFLRAGPPAGPSCLLLDVRLGRIDGLDVQVALAESGLDLPVIIMTGHGDIPMAVRGMRAGAIDFLAKPLDDQALLSAVSRALAHHAPPPNDDECTADIRRRYDTLSDRERQVMALVVAGLMNKQIAGHLSLSLPAIKLHRAHVMRKMGAQSLADLVRLGERLAVRDLSISRYPNPA
ncbi:response regulator transcription factor [Gluconacetobacter takamatsuzukensis]|uniref:Response regulator transcription factor n=1 Tax=Gluconacetobacter takamatsuzukensis TaxID=1286190 RepID=A0A7W4KES3_9PROT|nr:response regulator [Gluconacetobacter takamatsuzukensis]MBB2205578.1 response regulator transcription factor [Gluconacetobacter takamatsuzukensis]